MSINYFSFCLLLSVIASLIYHTIEIDCLGERPCCFIDPIITSHVQSIVNSKKVKIKVKKRKKGMWWKKYTVYHRGYSRIYQQKTYETYSERCPTRLQHCCEGIEVVSNNKPTPPSS
ncbi:hypothetical protein SNEBB_009158 [Seison nebaliae]|nr:hypothetical protein SNEBB_009158 [Seison nebaliae]